MKYSKIPLSLHKEKPYNSGLEYFGVSNGVFSEKY
jgi:hypothetical protein